LQKTVDRRGLSQMPLLFQFTVKMDQFTLSQVPVVSQQLSIHLHS